MVVKEEQERVKTLISDTVTLLCRNGLTYKSKFCINALIGITLDEDEIMLVDIRETIKNVVPEESADEDASNQSNSPMSRKRKKRKHRRQRESEQNNHSASSSDGAGSGDEDNTNEPPKKRIIKEENSGDESDDLVFIKDEPADTSISFGGALYQHQHQQNSQQQSGDILSSLAQHGQLYATPTASDGLPNAQSQWDPTTSQVPYSQSTPSAAASASGQLNMSAASIGDSSQMMPSPFSSGNTFHHFTSRDRGATAGGGGGHSTLRYSCSLCDKAYNTRDKLNAHLFTRHDMQTRSACPACQKSFTRKDVMMQHFRRVHGKHNNHSFTAPPSPYIEEGSSSTMQSLQQSHPQNPPSNNNPENMADQEQDLS